MQQVTSLKEIETYINQNGEMVIGKNNRNNVIVMSMAEYRKKLLDEEIEKKLLKSEEDYKQGRVRKAEDVFKEWEAKYGIWSWNITIILHFWKNIDKCLVKLYNKPCKNIAKEKEGVDMINDVTLAAVHTHTHTHTHTQVILTD